VLVSREQETAKLAKIKENLDHEYNAQAETEQLLADLKDKEAVAREMIAVLRGVRGRDAGHDRKAAQNALASAKQKRVLTERSLRRSQNRLRALAAQWEKHQSCRCQESAGPSHDADGFYVNYPPSTIHGTASRVAGRPSEGTLTARLRRDGVTISSENLLSLG